MQLSGFMLGLSREAVWIVIGQTMVVAGSLVGVGWLTRLMNPEQYGEFALGLTIALFINQMVMGPLSTGAMRYHSIALGRKQEAQYWQGIGSCMKSSAIAVILIGIAGGVSLFLFGQSQWAVIFSVSIGYSLVSGFTAVMIGIRSAARERSLAAIQQGSEVWARVLFAVILVTISGASSAMALLGYAIASFTIFVFQVTCAPGIHKKEILSGQGTANSWSDDIWSYSRPMIFFGAFTWLQMASDRWAIGWCCGAKEVGLYAVLMQLGAYPMSVITGMAVQLVAPILYQHSGDVSEEARVSRSRDITALTAYVFVAITVFAWAVTALFHEWIFRLFLLRDYWEVSYLLPWMVISGGLFSYGQLMALNLMSELKTRKLTVVKITTAIIGVSFTVAGAAWMGIAGVVYAGVLFSATYACWMALICRNNRAILP